MRAFVYGPAAAAALLLSCSQNQGESGQPEFSGERIKADISYLADDMLEGRGTGTKGYEIAARFLASRFMGLGLQPGNNGNWFQSVPFTETRLKPGAPTYVAIDGVQFANGVDSLVYPSPLYPDQKITGDAVFVGYGLDSPANGFDDYAGLDVRGKIVVALWGFPPGSPSEMAAHLNSDKGRMAQERGAIGMITVITPTFEKVVPWDAMRKRMKEPAYSWVGADGKPYSSAPKLQASGSLGAKASEALFAGTPMSFKDILAASEKPKAKVKGFPLGKTITVERHSVVNRITSPNVIGILPGSDPKLKNEFVVLSAHLDAIGTVEPVNGDAIVNGAMDNASGIATMLEVARAFTSSGQRPKRSIMFVGLAAEEKGLLGASYLAKHPVTGGGKLAGLVNLDMPILTYDFTDVVAFGAEHSTIGAIVAKAIASEGVKLTPDPEPEQVSFVRSDHYMFVKEGVPAVSLETGPANGGEAGVRAFGEKRYHQPADDMTQPFNWNAAAKFARINYLISREMADSPEPPRWYEGDFFGNTFAQGQPKAKR